MARLLVGATHASSWRLCRAAPTGVGDHITGRFANRPYLNRTAAGKKVRGPTAWTSPPGALQSTHHHHRRDHARSACRRRPPGTVSPSWTTSRSRPSTPRWCAPCTPAPAPGWSTWPAPIPTTSSPSPSAPRRPTPPGWRTSSSTRCCAARGATRCATRSSPCSSAASTPS